VTPGTALAGVVQPQQLKAELKIAETQAKDVQIGQKVSVDTHNGVIAGHVTRIDPVVQKGTATVDAAVEGALPPGARPDFSVQGAIEIARFPEMLCVGRPVHNEPDSTMSLFKLTADGSEAVRVQMELGRASVNTTVEILSGLQLGDQVILSDVSASESYGRIRLKWAALFEGAKKEKENHGRSADPDGRHREDLSYR
jgi:HlyD family secretion protein